MLVRMVQMGKQVIYISPTQTVLMERQGLMFRIALGSFILDSIQISRKRILQTRRNTHGQKSKAKMEKTEQTQEATSWKRPIPLLKKVQTEL